MRGCGAERVPDWTTVQYPLSAFGRILDSYNASNQTTLASRIAVGSIRSVRKSEIVERIERHGLSAHQGARPMESPVVKRSIVIAGRKTSVSLEDAFWSGLKEIASTRHVTLSALVGGIDSGRSSGNLSSAIRLVVLDHYRAMISAPAASRSAPVETQKSR
jgi:predicted DNA-binding ribbon-helix-helix protein